MGTASTGVHGRMVLSRPLFMYIRLLMVVTGEVSVQIEKREVKTKSDKLDSMVQVANDAKSHLRIESFDKVFGSWPRPGRRPKCRWEGESARGAARIVKGPKMYKNMKALPISNSSCNNNNHLKLFSIRYSASVNTN